MPNDITTTSRSSAISGATTTEAKNTWAISQEISDKARNLYLADII